jgi:hypothetical protein
MALVVLILLFLAWQASRRNKEAQGAPTPAELAHLERCRRALEQKNLAELNASDPSPTLPGPSPRPRGRGTASGRFEQMSRTSRTRSRHCYAAGSPPVP